MKRFAHTLAHRALAAVGLSAVRTNQTYEADRHATFLRVGIDLVIDVGANIGQYGCGLRRSGYNGAIVSLEPLPSAYAVLEQTARSDTKWHVINAAAGDKATRSSFNISADSVCSSLLQPSTALLDAIPTAKIVETVDVEVICLEHLTLPEHRKVALKLDVQGFERQAITGAGNLLERIDVLEIELHTLWRTHYQNSRL
jgi:FkbM family methyltransferase